MAFWSRLLGQEQKSSSTLTDPAVFSNLFGYQTTASGSSVTPESALRVPAVFAAVRVISESIAQLPLKLYKHLPDGGKVEAKDHPLFSLLNAAPNSFTTSFEWRLATQSSLCTHGNAYSFISRNNAGEVVELLYLHPSQVAVEIDIQTQEPTYRVTSLAGSQEIYTRNEIFHLRGIGSGQLSGYIGVSPLTQAREAIGLAMALEEHTGRLFSNGARPAGVVQFPQTKSDMSPELVKRLRDSFSSLYSGGANSGKTLILEHGATL